MKVLLTGGGTGGHLYPGLAIAEELRKRTFCQIHFVGTRRGLEAVVVPEKGYRFHTVWISGYRRGRLLGNLLFPVKVVVSLIQALLIVHRLQPDVVVGTGGYVSWPVMMASVLLRRKSVLQEQNAIPGVVTRVLASYVDSVHMSFETSTKFFKKRSNLHISGNPTREELYRSSRDRGCRRFGLDPGLTTLFVFGGSQGARSINEAVLGFLGRLMSREDVQVLWATGPRWLEKIKKDTEGCSDRVRLVPYIQDMGMAYGVSDLVICRAGATTVAEVTGVGVAAVLVPFPGAAGGHQDENAGVLWKTEAAEMVLEDQMEEGTLERVVFTLLDNTDRRKEMARRAKRFGKPHAAKVIVDDLLYQANKN